MARPIRIQTTQDWGTCFGVSRNGTTRFITAGHVLTGCGWNTIAPAFDVYLCDAHTLPPQRYTISNIVPDPTADYVEFDCGFPSSPYIERPDLIVDQTPIEVEGYMRELATPGRIPDCDRPPKIGGYIVGTSQWTPTRKLVTVRLNLNDPRPHGLSGSPVVLAQSDQVVAVFFGGPGQPDRRFGAVEVG